MSGLVFFINEAILDFQSNLFFKMKNIATYIKSYFESCKNIQTFQMGCKKKDEEGEDEHLVVLNGEIGLVNEKGFQSVSPS